jgi:UDP-N-acetylglucosamine acyltransferase
MSDRIHATAVIHSATRLDPSVTVGPYAVIEDGVELGENTVIEAHAIVRSGTVTGPRCQIGNHAVVGGLPQDLHFDPRTPSGVRLGAGVVVREGVTIHRATREGVFTEVGEEVFLMANSHVGHDCTIGAHAIIANNVMLAGFVTIGAHAFLGGGAALHQFIRIGESAMVSGLSRISRDVPPFSMMAERDDLIGLNLVGLKRRGFSRETIKAIKAAYRAVCGEPGNFRERAATYRAQRETPEPAEERFLEFFAGGKRGFIQPARRDERERE